jgi:hypothetical protein
MEVVIHSETLTPIYKTNDVTFQKRVTGVSEEPPVTIFTLLQARRRHHYTPKPWYPSSDLHCLTSHKTVIFLVTAMISSYLTYLHVRSWHLCCTSSHWLLFVLVCYVYITMVLSPCLPIYIKQNFPQIGHLKHKQVQNHHDIPRNMASFRKRRRSLVLKIFAQYLHIALHGRRHYAATWTGYQGVFKPSNIYKVDSIRNN